MELIKDLGLVYMTDTATRKYRAGIYLCPICETGFKCLHKSVENGNTTKCKPCSRKTRKVKHGLSGGKSKLYGTWNNMRNRCNQPTNKKYIDYGGRGITICEEWDDFLEFKKWSEENGYKESLSIDRIDNNGNYEPDNCRWTTQSVQARNTRIRRDNKTGFRGVRVENGKYSSRIKVDGNSIWLGCFNTAQEAGIAFDTYVKENNLEHTLNYKE